MTQQDMAAYYAKVDFMWSPLMAAENGVTLNAYSVAFNRTGMAQCDGQASTDRTQYAVRAASDGLVIVYLRALVDPSAGGRLVPAPPPDGEVTPVLPGCAAYEYGDEPFHTMNLRVQVQVSVASPSLAPADHTHDHALHGLAERDRAA